MRRHAIHKRRFYYYYDRILSSRVAQASRMSVYIFVKRLKLEMLIARGTKTVSITSEWREWTHQLRTRASGIFQNRLLQVMATRVKFPHCVYGTDLCIRPTCSLMQAQCNFKDPKQSKCDGRLAALYSTQVHKI